MKEGQVTVPVLLIIFLIMFLFYILWAPPGHVVDVLGLGEEENATNVTPPEEGKNIILEKKDLGIIGRATGRIIDEHDFGDVSVSYPREEEILKEKEELTLTASILNSPSYESEIEAEEGELFLEFSTESSAHPLLEAYFNGTKKLSYTLGGQEKSHRVKLGEAMDGDLRLACKWQGLIFWSKQDCEVKNLTVKREYYDDTKAEKTFDFEVGSEEFRITNNMRTLFKVENKTGEGKLEIRTNNVTTYGGEPTPRSASYSNMVKSRNINLIAGENTVSVRTEEGSSYNLTDLKLVSYEKKTEESQKSIDFEMPQAVSKNASHYRLLLNIEDIQIEGSISLEFPRKTYVKSGSELHEGWNSFYIQKEAVREGMNTFFIRSQSDVGGRFKISGLILKWVE